jgi:hypothetical protein
LELIKYYDCVISYHPGKANVVADALSKKSRSEIACLKALPHNLKIDIEKFDMEIVIGEVQALMAKLEIKSTFAWPNKKMRRSIKLRREPAKVKPWDSVSCQMVCSNIIIEFVYLIMRK